MEHGNQKTVYVVQVDNNKDLSDAKKYGALRAVFGNPRKPYDTTGMVAKARRVMINVLSWDRNSFSYMPQRWDFGQMGLDYDDFEAADDKPL